MSAAGVGPRPDGRRLVLAFATVYLCWGATFLAIRVAVADVPPLLTIALRCAGGALVLLGWTRWRAPPLTATPAQWRTAFLAGAFYFVGCHALMAWAEQRVSSGQTALLMTAVPIWLVLLESVWRRKRPPVAILAGVGCGVLGVALITQGAAWSGGTGHVAALLFASLAWAVGALVARHGALPSSGVHATVMQLTAGAICVTGAGAAIGEAAEWHAARFTPQAAGALAFLVLGGTVAGFGAYSWLLRETGPAAASTYSFVNPVVALGIGWAVGDDVVTGTTLAAAALVVGAVLLIWIGNRRVP
jgi:drug/metabolite transporter (DMT)-like permease